jgi:hypothetical protein
MVATSAGLAGGAGEAVWTGVEDGAGVGVGVWALAAEPNANEINSSGRNLKIELKPALTKFIVSSP